MLNFIKSQLYLLRESLYRYRQRKWWDNLRESGMQLGTGINLPLSTWIDTSHCFLISIGDNCGFGENCAILAHDAMPNEYIDATKIGFVKIRESCHFGMRTVILPGVEIGPRSIVGSNAVVINDIPPETVAGGNPAKVICSLDKYLERQKQLMRHAPVFPFSEYDEEYLDTDKINEMRTRMANNIGYIEGGYTAMLNEGKCLYRTS